MAQDFYWWNPSKLPTPAEWVTVRRARVKDAVNTVWWLSKTPWPKASNRRVLQPYSASMEALLAKGYRPKKRPSGHDISSKFAVDNGAAIPPNLIAIPNTESNSFYLRYCKENGLKPHPARFPAELPEYFIRMLTDPGDFVVDPFAGSCVTGEVCERIGRRWTCIELQRDYCKAALGRFRRSPAETAKAAADPEESSNYYRIPRPGILWNGDVVEPLPGRWWTETTKPPGEPGARSARRRSIKRSRGASLLADGFTEARRGKRRCGLTCRSIIESAFRDRLRPDTPSSLDMSRGVSDSVHLVQGQRPP